ncbi:MAG: hypothetical protein ACTHNQ_19465 [Microbacterium sp.]
MIDRALVEECVYRTAASSLIFDMTLSPAQLQRALAQEVEWCLQPLSRADSLDLSALRGLVEGVLVDPTTHRASLVAALYALAPEQGG